MDKKTSKTQEISKVDSVIDRLINEVRAYKAKLDEARVILSKTGRDHEKLSILGGIKKLADENKDLKAQNRALNDELDNLIRKKR